jgi:hypothetical protein
MPERQSIQSFMNAVEVKEKELLTRLIFAEGLSTNFSSHEECKEKGPEIFEAIAWGVMSRVRMGEYSEKWSKKYGKGIKGVIFKKNQFNPAISKRSKYSHFFMCPQKSDDWKKFWGWAKIASTTVIQNPHKSPFIESKWEKKKLISTVSHFYYPLSKQATKSPPKWANKKKHGSKLVYDLNINLKRIPEKCIMFFRHEKPTSAY